MHRMGVKSLGSNPCFRWHRRLLGEDPNLPLDEMLILYLHSLDKIFLLL